jgi:hypothetical protein
MLLSSPLLRDIIALKLKITLERSIIGFTRRISFATIKELEKERFKRVIYTLRKEQQG